MRYSWTPAKDNKASKFTVKVGSQSIVMERGKPFSFENEAHYKPFKARMEALLRAGEVSLEARDYSPKKEKAAPAPKKPEPAPASEQADAPGDEPSEEAPAGDGLDELTVAELKAKLDEKGAEYSKSAKKAELLALLRG
jgi:hypothetical protein